MVMPNLSIKQVPEHLAEKLRRQAASNHRSLQGELMSILFQALEPEGMPATRPSRPPPASIEPGVLIGTKTIEQVGAEVRQQWPRPVDSGPPAVDIVRRERDAHG